MIGSQSFFEFSRERNSQSHTLHGSLQNYVISLYTVLMDVPIGVLNVRSFKHTSSILDD